MKFFRSLKEQYYLLRQRRTFFKCQGYRLNLDNLRSYNEKVAWRKIYDRNPLFPLLADKYRSRRYVLEKLGKKDGEKILVPLLFVTEDPDRIPFDDLPEEYIIKPNHGSGWSIIVDRDHPARPGEIMSKCRRWMKKTYGRSKKEWAYSEISPLVMIEMLLKDYEEKIPADWKFDVINGRVATVYLVYDRFGNPTEALYDRDFKRLWACTSHEDSPEIERPSIFGEMVAIAEDLAFEMDQIRVDLYNVEGKIYFGELTLYSDSGLYRFEPVSFDFNLGEKWVLDRSHECNFKPWF